MRGSDEAQLNTQPDPLVSFVSCVFQASGPRCLCAAGFEGNGTVCQGKSFLLSDSCSLVTKGVLCVARDPCLVENGGCSPDAVCKRTRPGWRDCVCNNGFSGDGLVCVGGFTAKTSVCVT